MYLSKLEIFGFKSFVNKVQISFDAGITAIVGPNGCGKTNIVDAIRWVLGEQRSSTLRSDRMEDVIFAGTDRRKPLGMAEVLLTIQNTKGILPTEYSEVTIGRRLYRSGESEYLLNGSICRLKDIVDLFMDTGMGANAYSVIELKMVETILSDKTDDRRKLFEEAAGVTRYKHRRKEAYRRLENIQQDLMRVNDIVKEVQKSVNGLERQAKKAEEYNNLSDESKKLEVELLEREFSAVYIQYETLKDKLETAINDKNRIDEELSRREALLEVLREEMSKVEGDLNVILNNYNNTRDEYHKIEEEKIVSVERVKTLRDNVIRYEQEKVGAINKIKKLEESNKILESDLHKINSIIEQFEQELLKKQNELKIFDQKLTDKKYELKNERNSLMLIINETGELRNNYERTKARVDNIAGRLERGREENKKLEEDITRIDGLINDIMQGHGDLTENMKNAEIELQSKETERESLLNDMEKLREDLYRNTGLSENLKTRIQFIKGLVESKEDLPEGTRYLLQNISWIANNDGTKTLGEFINTDEQYKKSIALLLGEASGYIVVDRMEEAISGVEYLKREHKGRATFVVLENVKPPTTNSRILPDDAIAWVKDVINTSDRIKPVVKTLCNGVAIVPDIEKGKIVIQSPEVTECVTLAGERITSTGIVQGGEPGVLEDSLFDKEQQLNNLEAELNNRLQEKEEIERGIEEKSEQVVELGLHKLRKDVKLLEDEVSSLEIQNAKLQFEKNKAEEGILENNDESQRLDEESNSLSLTLNDLKPRIESKDSERSELEQKIGILSEEVERLETERMGLVEAVNSASMRHKDKINERTGIAREIEFAGTTKSELEDLITVRSKEISVAEEEVKRISGIIKELEVKSNELKEKISEIEKERTSVEKTHSAKRDEIQEIVDIIKDQRRLKEDSVTVTHQLEMKVNELSVKMSGMKSRAADEMEFELVRKEFPDSDTFDISVLKNSIQEIKERLRKLGGINFAAFEEYETEVERLKFLTSQRDDLHESETTLIETIDEINKTAQKKFMETFHQIRENFIRSFKSLFDEGDECDLRLVEDLGQEQNGRNFDPLDARIEIIAKPRGKRPTSINLLSGGEKTLTAIALLFAIYLVKPSPFCILDEVDAPLDDANIDRFTNMLSKFSENTQFIVVTHNKRTMEAAAALYGVTMEEKGVSKLVSVKFNEPELAIK